MQPSEVVMTPRQVFLSVLMFGVAGLLLFMYLQVWFEEQRTETFLSLFSPLENGSDYRLLHGVIVKTKLNDVQVSLESPIHGRVGKRREQRATSGWGPTHYLRPLPRIMTREKIQEYITNQNPKSHMPRDRKEKTENLLLHSEKPTRVLTETSHPQGEARALSRTTGSPTVKLTERHQGTNTLFRKFSEMKWPMDVRPLNKSLVSDGKWKRADATQEKRRSFLQEFCKKYGGVSRPQSHLFHMVSRIYVEDKHKILYCEVPKAGCSNWKRVLMVLSGLAPSADNISHDAVHYGKHLKKLDSFDLKGIHIRLNTYTKAVFVRDPMERLVSAFRDKFEHPNSYYHPVFGKAIIKKYRPNACEEALNNGSGVKFKEFIHYLLDSHRPVGMDIHWEKVSKLCYPCLISYDFVGKFETLEEDANYFLQLIGAPKELKFPNFKDRHASDRRTNAQVVRQYLKDLTQTERQLIYDFYSLDYLMFNYTTPFL
nr:carbohydrate sulfotransferase 9 isoform X1 [Camelus dromedarius]XP_031294880.1 carbohydrate sulfotransferase 9 isoform X1 [Camelus dromedarius]XP_031294881.1 carbohydrate sulfotransferase 9 isoform X1 [Camelus dromedarius]